MVQQNLRIAMLARSVRISFNLAVNKYLYCQSEVKPSMLCWDAAVRLPAVHLIHGSDDHVVPVSSSTCFGDALWKRGASVVSATVISGCGHYDLCMDLMETDRFWHAPVMNEIRCAFSQHMQTA